MARKKSILSDLEHDFMLLFEKQNKPEEITRLLFEEQEARERELAKKLRIEKATAARAKNKESELKIGKFKVPKNTRLYEKIESAARMKGQTVGKFMETKKNKDAVMLLARDGGVTVIRETEYLIDDIKHMPKKAKVFWNEREVHRLFAISLLTEIASLSLQYSNVVVINWEVRFDLLGNIHISHVPERSSIDEAIERLDEFDSDEERAEYWAEFLDQYDNINYIRS